MADSKPSAGAPPAGPKPPGPPPEPAIKLPKAPDGQMTLRVNGTDHFIDPKKYRSLIEALSDLGYDVPHFCYHPGLEPDGNCRMCYVNVMDVMSGKPMQALNLSKQPFERYPKPTISCREPLNPRGMAIETDSPEVLEARKWVMEFLLINHPLDCPVCDKAGECMLQNHSYDHGKADSRFLEAKNEKPPKDLYAPGQEHGIKLWTDRCITCVRCTRFLDQVAGTSELYVTNRGDRSEIDIAPGHPLDNELMGNIVDICPVGALIDKDLMFTYRAWYLQKADTVCPACSVGCNIQVQTQKDYVRRLVPRENREVNAFWMCDRGRHDFAYINADQRVMQGRINDEAWPVIGACEEAGRRLAEAAKTDAASVAVLASAWLTLEELHTLKELCAHLRIANLGLLAQADWERREFDKFTIEADRNPNRAGAKLVLGEEAEAKAAETIASAREGKFQVLYVVSSMPHYEPTSELVAAIEKTAFTIVQDLRRGPMTQRANIVLPGASYAEKDGVFVNKDRRAQVLRRAIDPLGQGHDDLAVLQRVAKAAGAPEDIATLRSGREVFRRLADRYPGLAGQTHQTLGRKGLKLQTPQEAAAGK